MNNHRGSIPQPYAISATERNLSESASSRKANTTLKLVIQSPDLGACLSHSGNIANSEKGNASAIAKPNIPSVGASRLCPAASTSSVPIIGPVHEKETMTSVKAISKILKNPPVLRALLSSAVDQESGNVISKSPKNDSAKTTSSTKKKMFTTAFVLRSLRADAPKSSVTNRPKPTYKMIILNPYKMASRLPPPFFKKNDTVIGMIGHTQGVNIASNPPNKPNTNISHNDLPAELSSITSNLSPLYSHTSGAVHILSSQALNRIVGTSAFASVMTNESVYSPSNSSSPNSIIFMCQPGSTTALSRTLSPLSSPLHVTGCTICAPAITGIIANNIIKIFLIIIVF